MFRGVKRLLDFLRAKGNVPVAGIHSVEVFKAFLDHERAVAERQDRCMCVVAFDLGGQANRPVVAQRLGAVCAERLRTTDVTGWLDDTTVGVMMPFTRSTDAGRVADSICERMRDCAPGLDYRLYLFPSDEEGGQAAGGNNAGGPGAADAGPAADGTDAGAPVEASDSGQSATALRARSLDDLCVPPLPAWKRASDLALALLGIVLSGPLMLLIAAWIKIVSPGPVLFRQERVGFRGRHFILYKFRSMKVAAETQPHQQYLAQLVNSDATLTKLDKADTRVIPLGKVLRASGLDELPQLFNILRGDMSLIGPRPCVPYEYEMFQPWHKRRCNAYPGLTGLWQVSGKNKTTFQEMMRYDNAYARRRNAWLDARILIKTIPVIWQQVREILAKGRQT